MADLVGRQCAIEQDDLIQPPLPVRAVVAASAEEVDDRDLGEELDRLPQQHADDRGGRDDGDQATGEQEPVLMRVILNRLQEVDSSRLIQSSP